MTSGRFNVKTIEMDCKMPASDISNDVTAQKEKNKLVRRALSMPRNLFRLSRRGKLANSLNSSNQHNNTTNDASNIGSHTAITVNGNVANAANATLPSKLNGLSDISEHSINTHKDGNKSQQNKQNRLFHRSTWKKLLTRVAHQMTSNNIAVRIAYLVFLLIML